MKNKIFGCLSNGAITKKIFKNYQLQNNYHLILKKKKKLLRKIIYINEIFDKWENLDSRKKKKVETLFVKIKKIINS